MLKQLRSIAGAARRRLRGGRADAQAARIAYLEEVVRYLDFQVANQASLLRYLAAPVIHELPLVRETKASFDFQWAKIPVGRFMLENEDFRKEAPGYVTQFTGLPAEWFAGKRVIDAGCGLGRYSWALCSLGARVLSIDQSANGVARTREACRNFPYVGGGSHSLWGRPSSLDRWAPLCPIIYNALESYKHLTGYHSHPRTGTAPGQLGRDIGRPSDAGKRPGRATQVASIRRGVTPFSTHSIKADNVSMVFGPLPPPQCSTPGKVKSRIDSRNCRPAAASVSRSDLAISRWMPS